MPQFGDSLLESVDKSVVTCRETIGTCFLLLHYVGHNGSVGHVCGRKVAGRRLLSLQVTCHGTDLVFKTFESRIHKNIF